MITSKIRRTAPYGAMFMISQAEIEVKTDKKKAKTKVVDLVSFSGQVDSHGVPLVLPIDQFSGKSFCLNPQGFPMNDIMASEPVQTLPENSSWQAQQNQTFPQVSNSDQ